MLEDVIRLNSLYDYYGELLTDNQKKCFELYYRLDNSLSEIADELGISKQGVFNNLKKAVSELEGIESKLRLIAKIDSIRQFLVEIDSVAEKCNPEINNNIKILTDQILEELNN